MLQGLTEWVDCFRDLESDIVGGGFCEKLPVNFA